MAKEERELPKPGKTPFSRKRREGEGQDDLLMADQMAIAAAEGRLNEYLEQEIPEGGYAKKLAMMMMGITVGSPPDKDLSMAEEDGSPSSEPAGATRTEEEPAASAVPQDVVNAVQAGDVGKLKELLAREKQRRSPDLDKGCTEEKNVEHQPQSEAMLEKDMLDTLIRIASENNLTIDWVVARALKLYMEEYQKTGRL